MKIIPFVADPERTCSTEIVVTVFSDLIYRREFTPDSGYEELVIHEAFLSFSTARNSS